MTVRAVACVALLLSCIVPIERPTARAENWRPVQNTPFCVDYDSEQFDKDEVTWAFKQCGSNDVGHARVDCAHQPSGTDGPVDWYLYDGSGNWLSESSSRGSPEYEMVDDECEGWAFG